MNLENERRVAEEDRRFRNRVIPIVGQPQPEMRSVGHEIAVRVYTFFVAISIVTLIGTMSYVLLAVTDTLRGTA
jgi:hypothetical protein